jgi:hypothetical protein
VEQQEEKTAELHKQMMKEMQLAAQANDEVQMLLARMKEKTKEMNKLRNARRKKKALNAARDPPEGAMNGSSQSRWRGPSEA